MFKALEKILKQLEAVELLKQWEELVVVSINNLVVELEMISLEIRESFEGDLI